MFSGVCLRRMGFIGKHRNIESAISCYRHPNSNRSSHRIASSMPLVPFNSVTTRRAAIKTLSTVEPIAPTPKKNQPRQKKMPIDLYYHPASSPCRAVQLTAKAVGVPINQHYVDLFAGAHLQPAFLAVNPQHTVPTLVDNGLVLTESRAICIYLVERYGKSDDPLYPRSNLQLCATINQRLYFDMNTLYASFLDLYRERLFAGGKHEDASKVPKVDAALQLLNTYLEGHEYAAGDQYTLADIVLVASISSYVHADGLQLDASKHANIRRWFARCKAVTPRYDVNVEGLRQFKQLFAAFKAR